MRPASDAPCTLFWPRSGCSPVPGRPIWPVISESAIRQRALSVPWVCCDTPMPQKMIADLRHFLRCKILDAVAERLKAFHIGLDILLVVKFLGDDRIEDAVEHRNVGAVAELQHMGGVALERLAARIHDDELRAALGRLLEESR